MIKYLCRIGERGMKESNKKVMKICIFWYFLLWAIVGFEGLFYWDIEIYEEFRKERVVIAENFYCIVLSLVVVTLLLYFLVGYGTIRDFFMVLPNAVVLYVVNSVVVQKRNLLWFMLYPMCGVAMGFFIKKIVYLKRKREQEIRKNQRRS